MPRELGKADRELEGDGDEEWGEDRELSLLHTLH